MLDDIRKPESERREWIVEALKDENGTYTGYLHKGELVRCKECKKANTEHCSHSYWDDDWGEWRVSYRGDDWYCADGEREGE